jgi:Dolichyl-phosphate-mannose-protein mannosyltransferase
MTIAERAEVRDSPTSGAVRRDHTAWWIAIFAAITSICGYAYFFSKGIALGYADSISHLQIAARTLDSPTAGFAQLGGVWLPVPHILMLPFVWVDSFYYSGFAGSVVSMAGYVVSCVYIYKTVRDLTKTRIPAIAGTLVFALNPNVLYMQSTPMTELLFFATVAAATYYVQKWIQTADHAQGYPSLFAGALALFLGCLTRYEAWIVTFVMAVVLVFSAWRKFGRTAAEGVLLTYVFFAGAAIALWIGWNTLIFANPLNFQNGEYAKPSLWVSEGEKAVGNPSVAIQTYWYAMVDNLGLLLVLLMLAGAGVLAAQHRKLDSLPTLGLLMMAPFFVVALTVGQRPLHVEQITGDIYNVRFGLLMVIPAAIITGYFITLIPSRAHVYSLLVACAVTLLPLIPDGPRGAVTVREGSLFIGLEGNVKETSEYLAAHYRKGEVILIESFGNESILFNARVPLTNNVYEGSYQKWDPALSDPPGQQIKWIVMRAGKAPDKSYGELYSSDKLAAYTEVFRNDLYLVYQRKA